jgi:ketol-acid reductoisomerase
MTVLHEADADPRALADAGIAVVGYGNQGRPWALNLRDAGLDVRVHARADDSRRKAVADGFAAGDIPSAADADVVCLLVPDDVIPTLDLQPRRDTLVVVASGYPYAFGGYDPGCDLGMVAPRMLGPEVRSCYEEGTGFITAVGVHADRSGRARDRVLALALALGGLRQGALELTPRQEAVLDLSVEQGLAPALRAVNLAFTQVMLEEGVPLEAIMCELFLSGETERTFRRLRLEGYAAQMEHHSPASQYGQLSRAERFGGHDLVGTMREVVAEITSGGFAEEWEAERDAGYPRLAELKATAVGPEVQQFEADLRRRLGETSI